MWGRTGVWGMDTGSAAGSSCNASTGAAEAAGAWCATSRKTQSAPPSASKAWWTRWGAVMAINPSHQTLSSSTTAREAMSGHPRGSRAHRRGGTPGTSRTGRAVIGRLDLARVGAIAEGVVARRGSSTRARPPGRGATWARPARHPSPRLPGRPRRCAPRRALGSPPPPRRSRADPAAVSHRASCAKHTRTRHEGQRQL